MNREKEGLEVTEVITYKTPLAVNGKPVTVSLALVEGVARNTIFSWTFLQTIKDSIISNGNALVIGLLGEQFNMEIMAPQRSMESPRTPEELSVLLQVSIIEKQNNMEDRGSMDRMV